MPLLKCFQRWPRRDLSDTTSDPDIMDSVGFHCGISQSLLSKSLPFIQPVTSQNLLPEAHMERYSMTFKNSVVDQPTAPMWHLNILCFHLFLSESSAASFQNDWTGRQISPCILPLLAHLITFFFKQAYGQMKRSGSVWYDGLLKHWTCVRLKSKGSLIAFSAGLITVTKASLQGEEKKAGTERCTHTMQIVSWSLKDLGEHGFLPRSQTGSCEIHKTKSLRVCYKHPFRMSNSTQIIRKHHQ